MKIECDRRCNLILPDYRSKYTCLGGGKRRWDRLKVVAVGLGKEPDEWSHYMFDGVPDDCPVVRFRKSL